MSETKGEHTNKIAMDILENEYGDYPQNWWHYDSEYKMLLKAQTQAWKQANEAAEQNEKALPMCGVVQQRELLTAFSDWMFMQHYHEPPTRELIDEYLGGL